MGRHKDIYKSKEWSTVRQYVISRAKGLCESCKKKGKVVIGKEVHHIVWLSDSNKHDWNIAYNPSNLILLCADCHNDIHDRSIGLQKFIIPP